MEVIEHRPVYFVRLEPGERLVASLKEFAATQGIQFASIVSGVGMASHLEMGFFDVAKNDYDRTAFDEILDLSAISGNLSIRDGAPSPHVHVVVNRPNYETLSGHLIEAVCHITMEVFLQELPGDDIIRTSEPGRPATFITRTKS